MRGMALKLLRRSARPNSETPSEDSQKLRRRGFIHNVMALYGVQACTYALPLLTFPYLAHVLGPSGWGVVVFAQAIGRWGNWFNNELFGGPTSLPWKLQIHKIDVVTGHLTQCDVGAIGKVGVCGYYQPTFLYESLWDVALGIALIYIGRRYTLGQSNLFALYVMGYTLGRGWIEALREDHANHFLGVRLNDWTALLVFIAGAIWFYVHRDTPSDRLYTGRRRPPPNESTTADPPLDPAADDGDPVEADQLDEAPRADAEVSAEKVAPTE